VFEVKPTRRRASERVDDDQRYGHDVIRRLLGIVLLSAIFGLINGAVAGTVAEGSCPSEPPGIPLASCEGPKFPTGHAWQSVVELAG